MKNTVTFIDMRRRYNGAIYTQVVTNLSLPPKPTEIHKLIEIHYTSMNKGCIIQYAPSSWTVDSAES
jgi:hypothetical protein